MTKNQIDITKIHTTELGKMRIARNLNTLTNTALCTCIKIIADKRSRVTENGKNFYITNGDVTITLNKSSHTIITAHKNSRPF